MKKYNMSEIMKAAWNLFRMSQKWVDSLSFAECLRRAWANAKKAAAEAEAAARSGLRRMAYAEYKRFYSDCKTVDGSYDKSTKTIEVLTRVVRSTGKAAAAFGICPRCHTYCYGDCRA